MRFSTFLSFVILILWSTGAKSNVVGADIQNFNPATCGLDFVTVQSSKTLMPGVINFGLFVNYSENTIAYYYVTADNERKRIDDTMLATDINLGVGLAKNWDAGISFPRVLKQKISGEDPRFNFSASGSTEIRINTKYRLLKGKTFATACVASMNSNRIVNNPYTGYSAGPTYNFELVFDASWNKWSLATNAGYRKRNSGEKIPGSPISPFKDQIIGSLGASYLLQGIDTRITLELFGSLPAKKVESGYNRTGESLEALSGLKVDLTRNFAIHAGGGMRLLKRNSSPDWRVYTGANITIGPLFSRPPPVHRVMKSRLLENIDPFAMPPSAPKESFIARDVLFKFDSHRIDPVGGKILSKLVKYIQQKPGYRKLIIEGHTDSLGSSSYNQSLSEERAKAVKNRLIKTFKLKQETIEFTGYGELRPLSSNANYQGRALNRRVEFIVIWREAHN